MSATLSRLFSKLVWAMLVSAFAGGFIIWLAGAGLDLREIVAKALRFIQTPDVRPLALTAIAILLILGGFLFPFIIRKFDQPPLSVVTQLRSALCNVHEHALDAVPDTKNADAALRRLSLLLHELEPYKDVSIQINELLDLSQSYLFELLPGGDEDRAVALHEKALNVLEGLLQTTSWALSAGNDT